MKRAFTALKDFLLPESCCLCGEVYDFFAKKPVKITFGEKTIESPYCRSCTKALAKSFDAEKRSLAHNVNATFLFDYSFEVVQKAIHHLKTEDCDKCFGFFAQLAGEYIGDTGIKDLTYIPRSHSLLRKNGFDQSERIISTFVRFNKDAKFLHIFERDKKHSKPQKTLSSKDRFINAQSSLIFNPKEALPKEIVVFDDVITTGATAETAAALLINGGAEKIELLFLAGARIIIEERRNQNE